MQAYIHTVMYMHVCKLYIICTQLRQYVISHVLPDGNEKPISFASIALEHSP